MKEILQPERVKVLREKRGLTLQQLADHTHISVSYLRKIESGNSELSYKKWLQNCICSRIFA